MAIFIFEAIVITIIYTIMLINAMKRNPLAFIDHYPKAIVERLNKLGLLACNKPRNKFKYILTKIIKSLFIACFITCLIIFINDVSNFKEGFIIAYGLWFIITWFDVLVIDGLWFRKDYSIRIKGSEDMEEAYNDLSFHIIRSIEASIIGLGFAAVVGAMVEFVNIFI